MSGIFSITGHQLNQLTPDQCMTLFGELLQADARKIKLPITSVNFSIKTTVPDGGIDASVTGDLIEKGDLIIEKNIFYQIKAGENFSPWQESAIKKELLDNKEVKKENLGEHVQYCFGNNGTYVLVCMKIQITPEQKIQAEGYLKAILTQCGISNPKVAVWGQEKIVGCIQIYPSIALRITGRNEGFFQSHREWGTEEEMRKPLVLGEEQNRFIQTIQTGLSDYSQAVHLNVYGETGVGKTRLVFEATKIPAFLPLVVYCDSPRNFLNSILMRELIRDENMFTILVIDECNSNDRADIWNKLKNLGHRIKLITIYNEYDKMSGTTKQVAAPNLDDDKIQKIIFEYYHDNIIAGQFARLCGGIPRFAHVIGWDLQNNPTEILRGTPDTNKIFDRYINYGDNPESEVVKQRKRILSTIALFKKFGNVPHFKNEADAVLKLVQKIDSSMTMPMFQEQVKLLQKRKILQGEDTLYISPKALHLWLWMKWWEVYGHSISFDEIVQEIPGHLLEWFFAMFDYAATSDIAKSVVKELFSETGPLHDSGALRTELGSRLFHSLALTDPHTSIDYLERTVGTWSSDELKRFRSGRRNTIYGLERIIFEPDLFVRGGKLLRNLAESENEEWSNNATGLFTGLFSLGPGYVSITKTPPHQRIPLLKETLCSQVEERRQLGLRACDAALEAVHFTRSSGLSSDEIRIEQKGWEPTTRKEWQDAYEEIINLLVEKIETFPPKDQKQGSIIIYNSARGLLFTFPNMGNYITDKLSELRKYIDEETALKDIINILEYDKDKLKPEIKLKLEKLRDEITGSDYQSLMKRYVGMDIMVDLAKKDREKEREEKIKQLSIESLDVKKLESQLGWLVTLDAKNGYKFGYELSASDADQKLLPTIIAAQRNVGENGSGFFLSGYLLKIYEDNQEEWNKIMRGMSTDQKLIRFFPELAWRSGITDEIGLLLLELIKDGKIDVKELSWFSLGGVGHRLSDKVIIQWIKQMLQSKEQQIIFNALALFNSFFIHRQKKSLDPDLTYDILTHETLFDNKYPKSHNNMVDYYWQEIALEFIEQHPRKSLDLAQKMLEHMGADGPIIHYMSQAMTVLDRISTKHPNEIWDLVTRYVDLPVDERGYAIVTWMRGGLFNPSASFIELVDYRKIFDWIDHDPHRRAPFMANHAPPYLRKDNCLTRELLIKYGTDEKVRTEILANFSTGGFSGSASAYYQSIKDKILTYKETEENVNVKSWIDFYVKVLDEDIKREKLREEREF